MDSSYRATAYPCVQVPVAIGGKGLPEGVKFADPGPEDAGLTNVTGESPAEQVLHPIKTPAQCALKWSGFRWCC